MKKNNPRVDYTVYGAEYQVCLPMEMEILIPSDATVRLLNAVLEEMDYSKLTATYSRIRRIEHSPRVLFKVVVYAFMRGIFSDRGIETACRENINFMYLLEGAPAPDHNTIARFRKEHLPSAIEDLLRQLVELLAAHGEISFSESAVFIDGTKIEANGNKYQFVWKKVVNKNREKMHAKMQEKLPGMLECLGLEMVVPESIRIRWLKKLRRKLYASQKENEIKFVYGKGHHKSALQKVLEQVNEWLEHEKRYTTDLYICGERNSYCKTDPDATFMRMKEDHMRNGQLKAGYNVNVATVSEYIVGNYISADRTDTKVLIPFLEKLCGQQKYPVKRIAADSAYESEEIYKYIEEHEQLSLFVKPTNHEVKKTKKYQNDIGRRENMAYDEETDEYTCAQGKKLRVVSVEKRKTSGGYPTEITVYECEDCRNCPCKEKCIRQKKTDKVPLEERVKRLHVSKYFVQQRDRMAEKICTDEGILLRVNRSIQAEGVFAFIKQDLKFRRFMTRGRQNVATEWNLLSIAYNLLKLHHKIQNGRLGRHLITPKAS